jgi:hypothetical protein
VSSVSSDDPRRTTIAGILSSLRPSDVVKVFGGHSDGTLCTICGRRMSVGSVDYELVVDGAVRAKIDRECLELWMMSAGHRSR